MKTGSMFACDKTGFFPGHAMACESVANRTNCIILFREPGGMAQGLIGEHYCMKGFRIDTKSCSWGPMSGFVCADPRLTKDSAYAERNQTWTNEALSGHIVKKFFGDVKDAEWKGDIMPIAISKKRIDDLERKGVIDLTKSEKDFIGESRPPVGKGDTLLTWRLVPAGNATSVWWLNDRGKFQSDYYVLCVNKSCPKPFKQIYPPGIAPIKFRGHETILGLINPGTKERGFKACVTADYDLFAIWPAMGKDDRMAMQHNLVSELQKKMTGGTTPLPGGVARTEQVELLRTAQGADQLMQGTKEVDIRLQAAGHREHHRFGDVSARTMNAKVLLNTALQGGGFQGGNAIHHNDEAGNFALAKGTLMDCMPLIGFLPGTANKVVSANETKLGWPPRTVLVENLADFRELVLYARDQGFQEVAKTAWLKDAGL
jgi:hypothetical protein